MKTITADSTFLSAIKQFSEPTEILDQDGHIVATVYPNPTDDTDFMERIHEIFDLDNLRRLKGTDRENDRTTAQVLARLRAMDDKK